MSSILLVMLGLNLILTATTFAVAAGTIYEVRGLKGIIEPSGISNKAWSK